MTKLNIDYPLGSRWMVERDGFIGTVQGWYITREQKEGVVLQQENTMVVHVYNSKWLVST